MTKDEAMKLALKAFEALYVNDYDGYEISKHEAHVVDDAITALRQALEQPEQESDCNPHPDAPHGFNRDASHNLDRYVCECEGWDPPEHEPVGEEWTPCVKLPVVVHVRNQREGETHVSTREGITPVKPDDLIMRGVAGEEYPIGRELFERTYTFDIAPPKREWVSLTDDELSAIWGEFGLALMPVRKAIASDIEAKLKEKNIAS